MLKWPDVLRFTVNGNPKADKTVIKTNAQWRELLTNEVFQITRLRGTEMPNSSGMCSMFEPGLYGCACCGVLLFDASEKFESGSGWPSFTQPIKENVIGYHKDTSLGTPRIEAVCNTCDAHLGHVFPDGPEPSGLRYCMNALSLKKMESNFQKATFGGGCFWCTEAVFQQLRGVEQVMSGYSGGRIDNPSYPEICSGLTGHAEVIQITFEPSVISYDDLVSIHLTTHDPTTLNRQGTDQGTQYRSVIFTHNSAQLETVNATILELKTVYDTPIVTEVKPFASFFKAEIEHQNYYNDNPNRGYCQAVIDPKLQKFKAKYAAFLK